MYDHDDHAREPQDQPLKHFKEERQHVAVENDHYLEQPLHQMHAHNTRLNETRTSTFLKLNNIESKQKRNLSFEYDEKDEELLNIIKYVFKC